jgi:regulator of replication initiation timing
MSHSRENTIFTQFSVSSDSVAVDDSLLISGFIEDMTNSRMSLQKENSDLQLEMELINEDRHRLQKENQELKAKLEKTHLKTVQIELLSKIATSALEKNYKTHDLQSSAPWNSENVKKGRISPIVKRYLISRTSTSTSPLIICRGNSKITTYRKIINRNTK